MKAYRVLIIALFAVPALGAYAFSAENYSTTTGGYNQYAALSLKDGSGVLHDYYIGLHSPDGNCVTKVIRAQSLAEAVGKGLKTCRNCAVYNFTDNFTAKNNAFAVQSLRYCPISGSRK